MRRATLLLEDHNSVTEAHNETMKKSSYFEKVNRYIYYQTCNKSKQSGMETFRNEIVKNTIFKNANFKNANFKNENCRMENENTRTNKYPISNNININNSSKGGQQNMERHNNKVNTPTKSDKTKHGGEKNKVIQRNRNKQSISSKSLSSLTELSDTLILKNEINKTNIDTTTTAVTTAIINNSNIINNNSINSDCTSSNTIHRNNNNNNNNTTTNTNTNTTVNITEDNNNLKKIKEHKMKSNKSHIHVCKICYLQKVQDDVEQMKIRKLKTTVYPREFNNYMQYEKVYQMILAKKKKLVKCREANEKKTFINNGKEFLVEIMNK